MQIITKSVHKQTGRTILVQTGLNGVKETYFIVDKGQTLEELEIWAKARFGVKCQYGIIKSAKAPVKSTNMKKLVKKRPILINEARETTLTSMVDSLTKGLPLRRKSWADGTFIFKQVPATISVENIVPNMAALPIAVKQEFKKRFDNIERLYGNTIPHNHDTIDYTNQVVIVKQDNTIGSYSVTNEDLFATDWELI